MNSDYDVSGLSPRDAKEFLLAHIATLKETEKQLESATQEAKTWEDRIRLAKDHGKDDLAAQAELRLEELRATQRKLIAEAMEMKKGIDVIRSQLPGLRAESEVSVDAEALNAELEAIAGKPDPEADAMKDLAADAALAELKKKLQGDG